MERRIGRGLLDLLPALPAFAFGPALRRWHMRWGATDAEVAAPMAGDDIVLPSTFTATRAITIGAPPEDVWPWIVQMGYRRAGFYTYDVVDNGGYPSADRVLDEYQTFAVGDWAFPMNGFFGVELPLNETVRLSRQSLRGRPVAARGRSRTARGRGCCSRCRSAARASIVRIRARPASLFWTLFMEFGDPPMAVTMLRGIRERAERLAA